MPAIPRPCSLCAWERQPTADTPTDTPTDTPMLSGQPSGHRGPGRAQRGRAAPSPPGWGRGQWGCRRPRGEGQRGSPGLETSAILSARGVPPPAGTGMQAGDKQTPVPKQGAARARCSRRLPATRSQRGARGWRRVPGLPLRPPGLGSAATALRSFCIIRRPGEAPWFEGVFVQPAACMLIIGYSR